MAYLPIFGKVNELDDWVVSMLFSSADSLSLWHQGMVENTDNQKHPPARINVFSKME